MPLKKQTAQKENIGSRENSGRQTVPEIEVRKKKMIEDPADSRLFYSFSTDYDGRDQSYSFVLMTDDHSAGYQFILSCGKSKISVIAMLRENDMLSMDRSIAPLSVNLTTQQISDPEEIHLAVTELLIGLGVSPESLGRYSSPEFMNFLGLLADDAQKRISATQRQKNGSGSDRPKTDDRNNASSCGQAPKQHEDGRNRESQRISAGGDYRFRSGSSTAAGGIGVQTDSRINSWKEAESRGFFDAVITCSILKFCCFSGRASRTEFLWFMLFNTSVLICFGLLGMTTGYSLTSVMLYILIQLVLLLPNISLLARRLHDINITALLVPLFMIPYYAVVFVATAVTVLDSPETAIPCVLMLLTFTAIFSLIPPQNANNRYNDKN